MNETVRTISVNGAPREVEAGTVVELLAELGLSPERPGIAVAVQGSLVPRGAWAELSIADGESVEIITAVQGG